MPHFIRALLISLLALSAQAQSVATFTYQRGQITVVRAKPPLLAVLPWQDESAAQPASPTLTLAVDIRPAASLLQQEGWMNLGSLQPESGLLFVFDAPQIARIPPMHYYQPLDILWVDEHGVITAIAPKLLLLEPQAGIAGDKPSKALLFLSGGNAETAGISPGDRITGSEFFTAAPKIISSPASGL